MECLVYHSAFILYAHMCRCIEATPFSVDLEVSSPNLWTNLDEENLASAKFLEEVAIHNSYHYLFHVTQSHFTCLNTHPSDFPTLFSFTNVNPPGFFLVASKVGLDGRKPSTEAPPPGSGMIDEQLGLPAFDSREDFHPRFFVFLESLRGGSFTKFLASHVEAMVF